jgi:hypothetical protein
LVDAKSQREAVKHDLARIKSLIKNCEKQAKSKRSESLNSNSKKNDDQVKEHIPEYRPKFLSVYNDQSGGSIMSP